MSLNESQLIDRTIQLVAKTKEQLLQEKWLKTNKPNAFFDTLIDKRKDQLLGTEIEFIFRGKKIKDTIVKRRSYRDEDYILFHIYFDSKNREYTEDKIAKLLKEMKVGA